MTVLVVGLGGHALLHPGEDGDQAKQLHRARETARCLVDALAADGLPDGLVVVHGNGPQVGQELLRMHHGRAVAPVLGLDACVAATQGTMGYFLGLALDEVLAPRGRRACAVITTVRVDGAALDRAPAVKPVGPSHGSEAEARAAAGPGATVARDADRGFRQFVPSPAPIEVLELPALRALLDAGMVVVAGGGGGIPVVRDDDGGLRGVEGVVDKDHTAALLARELDADGLVHLTAVDAAYRGFGTDHAVRLARLEREEARRLLAEGQFPPGTMGPKVASALAFLDAGGRSARITSPERLRLAMTGAAGTELVP